MVVPRCVFTKSTPQQPTLLFYLAREGLLVKRLRSLSPTFSSSALRRMVWRLSESRSRDTLGYRWSFFVPQNPAGFASYPFRCFLVGCYRRTPMKHSGTILLRRERYCGRDDVRPWAETKGHQVYAAAQSQAQG